MLRLRYEGVDGWADVVIDERGRNVTLTLSDDTDLTEVAELLLGPIFSCVLSQRGLTRLHASVLDVEGCVIALAGSSGAGKSTTAVALLQRGAALVCDDIAALGEQEGRFTVCASAPRVRMRPDAAAALVGASATLEPVWPGHESRRALKAYLPAAGAEEAGERALGAVFLLGERSPSIAEPRARPLTSLQALPRLMARRHIPEALDRNAHRRDFERLARLAETIPVYELLRPAGLEAMGETVAEIVSHL
jgi:hypothetical protein